MLLALGVVPAMYQEPDDPQALSQASPMTTGDFQIMITTDPQNATVALDEPINITITIQSINGSPGNVVVGLVQALPDDGSGPSCPDLASTKTLTPNPNASWTFTCWSGDQPLAWTLNIRGASESQRVHNATVNLTFLVDTDNNQASSATPNNPSQQSLIPPIYLLAAACAITALSAGGLTAYFVRRRPMAPRP